MLPSLLLLPGGDPNVFVHLGEAAHGFFLAGVEEEDQQIFVCLLPADADALIRAKGPHAYSKGLPFGAEEHPPDTQILLGRRLDAGLAEKAPGAVNATDLHFPDAHNNMPLHGSLKGHPFVFSHNSQGRAFQGVARAPALAGPVGASGGQKQTQPQEKEPAKTRAACGEPHKGGRGTVQPGVCRAPIRKGSR